MAYELPLKIRILKRLSKLWLGFLDLLINITILLSLVMCPVSLVYIIYYTFFCFNAIHSLIGCVILVIMPHINIKMQGAK